ncbi:lipopolysaccharide biosynthesis protein [Roseateles flavus]|uniref:Lipopolysaccharide biosynthesis protein n=1 Tax=Roseateles flavus TaxID=3149041 RepID=A0ABV0GAL0_9BURK
MGLKDAWAYLALRAFNGALAFASLACLTRWLDAEAYGRYALGIGLIGAAASISYQWLGTATGRFYAVHSAAPDGLLATVLRTWCALSLGLLALAWLAHALGWQSLFNPMQWLLISVGAILMGLFNLFLQWANARAEPRRYGRMTVLRAALALGLAALVLRWPGLPGSWAGETLALACAVAALLVACALAGIANPAALRHGAAPVALAPLARYGLPQAGGFLAIMVLDQSDRFIIQHWQGSAAVGGYAAGYDLAQQSMGVLLNVFYLGAFPHLVRLHEQGSQTAARELYVQTAETVMLVAGFAAAVFIVLSSAMARLIFGQGVAQLAAEIMPWIAVAIALGGIKAYVLDLGFQLHKRTRATLLMTAFMALLNIALNLLLVPHFGVIAAAWSAVAAFGLGAGWSYLWGRHRLQMPALGRCMLGSVTATMTAVAVGSYGKAIWMPDSPTLLATVLTGLLMTASYFLVALGLDLAAFRQLTGRMVRRLVGHRIS